ncbi:hypothetical protein [Branchiibius hedensis]|uniref:hypothetical protein n=1 Tax=Branchiibius hedensis TaxID=672460 RepID=UPI001FE95326|nr:hypothetical protein [Branchiibius hedensis]
MAANPGQKKSGGVWNRDHRFRKRLDEDTVTVRQREIDETTHMGHVTVEVASKQTTSSGRVGFHEHYRPRPGQREPKRR